MGRTILNSVLREGKEMTQHITTLRQLRDALPLPGARSRPLSLVPTMGALHEGHRSLVRKAREDGAQVLATVFVNPLQFGPGEDFDRYPRTLGSDLAALEEEGVEWAFFPEASEIVPKNPRIRITHPVAELYCGASRPGHFEGVLSIVSTFFHLVGPDRAYFGKKDRQQLFLIEQMVRELLFPLEIRPVETFREPDGLAMSSRNRYLTKEERRIAPELVRLMTEARDIYAPESQLDRLGWMNQLKYRLKERGFRPDYVALVEPRTFLPLDSEDPPESPAILLAAAWLGTTRLIDNIDIPARHV